MAAPHRSAVRRTGQVLTGLGALVVLCALLAGGPVALLALAGNPLPDHLPTLAEIGTALTTRDDGRLFLRALAVVGWLGWASFALSVLVEVLAAAVRRPAPRLPGMSRQQRAAAALVGSVALILAATPAAASAATLAGPQPVAAAPQPVAAAPQQVAAAPALAAPQAVAGAQGLAAAQAAAGAPVTRGAAPPAQAGPGLTAPLRSASDSGEPGVYRVAKGDYLGTVAERYLDDFDRYRELARLNRLADPDRIRPGQLLKLPEGAVDEGARRHATGQLVTPASPARPVPGPRTPVAAPPAPAEAATPGSAVVEPAGPPPAMSAGASRATAEAGINRPLAISAVLAVASIVGAQIGAVLGLRRRPAPRAATPALPAGRHRRD